MKCCICGREFETTKTYWGNDSAPLFLNKSYEERLCCNECNENVVIPVRIFYDKSIREKQYKECKGDWYEASRELFKNITMEKIKKDIPSIKEYFENIEKGGK